jgi:hypothetical protein
LAVGKALGCWRSHSFLLCTTTWCPRRWTPFHTLSCMPHAFGSVVAREGKYLAMRNSIIELKYIFLLQHSQTVVCT